jgi:hypothetical protein
MDPVVVPSMLKTIQSLQDRAGRYSIGCQENTRNGTANKGSGSMFFRKRVSTEEALVRYVGARTFLVVMSVWFFGFGILGSVQVGSAQQASDSLGAADPF